MAIAPHKQQASKRRQPRLWQIAIIFLLALTLIGCANRPSSVQVLELPEIYTLAEPRQLTSGKNGTLTEVAPPAVLLDLNEFLEDKQPQVGVTYPNTDQVIESTNLTAKIKVRGLSIYKEEKFGLGPHIQISLDNQPARAIYDLDAPIEFTDLAPGTHTLRAIAVKPWGESFKNDGAFSETTFHVFAPTQENRPTPEQPELIYNQPQGTYGAEPVLLDFYLNNAPLHLLAAEDETLQDWKIRCDINGQSFTFDQWQPIYLRGFKPGQNWIKLTLLDTEGNPIPNTFNSTVRLINYDPSQPNAFDQLMRGELPLRDVGQIADPNYVPPALPEPVQEPVIEVAPPATVEDTVPPAAPDREEAEDANLEDANEAETNQPDLPQENLPDETSTRNSVEDMEDEDTEPSSLKRFFERQDTPQDILEKQTDEPKEVLEAPSTEETIEATPATELDLDESKTNPVEPDTSNTNKSLDGDSAASEDDDTAAENAATDNSAGEDLGREDSKSVILNSEDASPAASASSSKPGFFNRIQDAFKQIREPQTTVEAPQLDVVEPGNATNEAPNEAPSESDDSALEDTDTSTDAPVVDTSLEAEQLEAEPDVNSASPEESTADIPADSDETNKSNDAKSDDLKLEETDTESNTLTPTTIDTEKVPSSTPSFFDRIQSAFKQTNEPQATSSEVDQPKAEPEKNLIQEPSTPEPSVLDDTDLSSESSIETEIVESESDIRQPDDEGIEEAEEIVEKSKADSSALDEAIADEEQREASDANSNELAPKPINDAQTQPATPSFFNRIQSIFQPTSQPQADATNNLEANTLKPSSGLSEEPPTVESSDALSDTPLETSFEKEPALEDDRAEIENELGDDRAEVDNESEIRNEKDDASFSADELKIDESASSQPIPQTLTAPSAANDILIEEPTLPAKNLTD